MDSRKRKKAIVMRFTVDAAFPCRYQQRLGWFTARDINHTDETIVAVIGDGALSGGMAYEALNNMARLRKEKKNLIIILNDNKMSHLRKIIKWNILRI